MNISLVVVTNEVLKLVTFKDVNREHPSNILFIAVTLDVLHPLISKELKLEHPANILLILVINEAVSYTHLTLPTKA